MRYSRRQSAYQATLDIASGFVVSLLVWVLLVKPLWGIEVTMFDNLAITCVFTVSSLIRAYFWRRFWERRR